MHDILSIVVIKTAIEFHEYLSLIYGWSMPVKIVKAPLEFKWARAIAEGIVIFLGNIYVVQ